ncbi:MAG: ribosome small subunit-dependent GTPase A [Crocinitomicaceae bacterium]|nr:ribosome small subunit-dependent GTPase A [Crocinitomicaceae bacterium]
MKKGLVLKSTGKWYDVKSEDGQLFHCQIRGKLRLKGLQTTNPVAAGDRVFFETEREDKGNIVQIEERRNYIIRRSVNLSKEAQIVAANIDRAFLVVTTERPQTTPGFIDRYLVTAEAYGIPVTIVFHKMDQYAEDELDSVAECIETYAEIGYDYIQTSIPLLMGLDELKERMKDRVCLFSGHSGTGKSSLINQFIPEKELRTGEISDASQKGQHTTTFAEMHELPFGGYVVDTPGIKGFGIVDIPKDELHHYFIEFFRLLPECRFNNCKHVSEPGCAVIAALERDELALSRYNSYLSMLGDQEERSPYR